jgi:thioredoxin 1
MAEYSEMEISAEEFDEVITSSNKLIVVNFFAEWHMPCLMFFPVIEDLAEQMKEVKFVKMNIKKV